MKDEINKIIQSISDFYKLDNALKYYLDRHKAQILLDYITNLQEEKDKQLDKYKNVIDKIKEYVKENKKILYQGRNEFTCEIQYSDEVVKVKDILELLEEVE